MKFFPHISNKPKKTLKLERQTTFTIKCLYIFVRRVYIFFCFSLCIRLSMCFFLYVVCHFNIQQTIFVSRYYFVDTEAHWIRHFQLEYTFFFFFSKMKMRNIRDATTKSYWNHFACMRAQSVLILRLIAHLSSQIPCIACIHTNTTTYIDCQFNLLNVNFTS